MIDANKILKILHRESAYWKKQIETDFTRGWRRGLAFSIKNISDEHERIRLNRECSPFIWNTYAIRRMIRAAINCFNRCDRGKGLALLEKVLTIPSSYQSKGDSE